MSIVQHTPASRSADLTDLYRRAIAEPSTVTRANKNKIIRAPSPDTEDRICRSQCGLSMPDLYEKTLCNPEDLTEIEAKLVKDGVSLPTRAEIKLDQATIKAMPLEQRTLFWDAVDAVTTDQDTLVKNRAAQKLNALISSNSVGNMEPKTGERGIAADSDGAPQPLWVQMIEKDNAENWGFICFRTRYESNIAWAEMKRHIDRRVRDAIQKIHGTARIDGKFKIVYIEDKAELDEAMPQVLQDRFKSEIGKESASFEGLRKDCFLSVDDSDGLMFSSKSRLPLSCWEAGFDAKKPLSNGYVGCVTLPVHSLIDPLYKDLLNGRMPLRLLYNMTLPTGNTTQ